MANIASGFALALHGGAGTLRCGEMAAERETAYRGRAVACTCGRVACGTIFRLTSRPPIQEPGSRLWI
jgi:hypothetical protein